MSIAIIAILVAGVLCFSLPQPRQHLEQIPLTNGKLSKKPSHKPGSARLSLEQPFTYNTQFFAKLSVGNPPQPLDFFIDITPMESAVASSDCETCCDDGHRFNHTLSTTYHNTGRRINVDHRWMEIAGHGSLDSFRVGSIAIENHSFIDAEHLAPPAGGRMEDPCYEAVLSLAPSNQRSQLQGRSLFVQMVEDGLLEKNLFALHLREPMEISFGELNPDLISGELIEVPLTNKTGTLVTGTWQTSMDSVVVEADPGFRFSLENFTAAFVTDDIFIRLPDHLFWTLLQGLDFTMDDLDDDGRLLPPYVKCEQRGFMPDVTFGLGGRHFTLSPFEYTLDWTLEGGARYCITAIGPTPVKGSKEVLLGSSFLRIFYSVFDLERRVIGFWPIKL